MPEPRFHDGVDVDRLLPWEPLIAAIEAILDEPGAAGPERTVHAVPADGGADATLLLKPGWVVGDVIVVKVVTFFPDNGQLDLPTVNAGVVLFDGVDGRFLGACDGNVLTTRRTAAASAVAAKRLARTDARRLLVVGTGALAPMAARAHATVRTYDTIEVWGRERAKAGAVAAVLSAEGLPVEAVDDLDASVATADVITCVTSATEPLVRGALLQAGTHIDLVGSFTPDMREADDDVVRRATVVADTLDDALVAGDLAQPLAAGVLDQSDIVADLADLVTGRHPGRTSDTEITVFKSAGFALEDVAAARLVFAGFGPGGIRGRIGR